MRYVTSFISNLSKGIALGTGAALLALGAPSTAEAITINWKFGLVGVVFNANQAVRVNVANVGDPKISPAPCEVRVQFFEGITGTLLKVVPLTVQSGRTQSADLGANELIPLKGTVAVATQVTVGDPNISPACGSPSLEVFDKVSGRTAVADGAPYATVPVSHDKPNNPHFPPLFLAAGQVMRVNVVNYGAPEIAPCDVRLAIFAADGSQVGQAREVLGSGRGTFLDVGVGNPDQHPQPFRAMGGRVVSPNQTLCLNLVLSVEVYDAATGIAALRLYPWRGQTRTWDPDP